MDIQIQGTPKKTKRDPFCTPPHSNNQNQRTPSPKIKLTPCETPPRKQQFFQTPPKTPSRKQESGKIAFGIASGFKPKENPESRKHKQSPFNVKHESSFRYQQVEVSPFYLTRLQQDYSLVQALGKGHFSQVGLYRSQLSGEVFAIKTTKASRMSVNQVQALGSLWVLSEQCAHVVRYYHSWIEYGQLFLVMEYCQDSLQKYISKYRAQVTPIPQKMIISHIRAALFGLESIHKYGILHLDVKPENILFKENTLKIADFGLCRAAKIRTGVIEEGDSRYLAKEVLNLETDVDLTKADIFSLGMTAYEMLTLETLPNNGKEWLQIRETGIQIEGRMDLTGYSQSLLSVVEKMGAARWQDRPSASQLLHHPLFKQSNRVNWILSSGKSNKKRQSSM